MRYQIDEKTTTMNYRYICPQTIFGIFMQNYKMFIGTSYRDAKHASGKY